MASTMFSHESPGFNLFKNMFSVPPPPSLQLKTEFVLTIPNEQSLLFFP